MAPSAVDNLIQAAFDDMRAGRLSQAEWTFRKILQREPRNHTALHYLGIVAHQTGRKPLAADLLAQAASLAPSAAQYHYNLALTLHELGRFEQAAASYRRAIALDPGDPMPRNNLGNVLRENGRLEEAIACFRDALRLRPDNPVTLSNLAGTLQQQGLIEEAVALYREAIARSPNNSDVHTNLLLCLNYDASLDPASVFEEHRTWARRHADPLAPAAGAPTSRDESQPLRVGYVSSDFRQHPVAYFIRPVLEHHDRARFTVTCYSNTLLPDTMTESLRSLGHAWRDVSTMSDEQLARQIRSDGIDVLVDLSGHTARHRLLTFARRPAPVQVTWIGYPNTTGMAAMDYRITDDVADPPGTTESLHTETLLRLESGFLCYRPPDGADVPAVDPPPSERRGYPTFVSFNNFAKVTPPVVETWSRILREIPDARLMLKAKSLADPASQRRAGQLFAAHGIDPRRLEISAQQPSIRPHLEHYGGADVALDTFPYNGTTTTCEALLMGVPVVTLAGRTHVSRVGASLLRRVGMDDFVATSPDDYVRVAVGLARDAAKLRATRAELRDRLMRSPLTDARSFTRTLEDALRRAWGQRRSSPARG